MFTRPTHLLLYGGGVDSVVCLKKLVDEEIVPFIFHFKTGKMNKTHERMIKKTVKILSPNSPYYVFPINESGYHAVYDSFGKYFIHLGQDKKGMFVPSKLFDIVVLGYTHLCYSEQCKKHGIRMSQSDFIDIVKKYNLPFKFPIANLTRIQTDKEFNKLPKEVKINTVSTTRNYDFGGVFAQKMLK
jgi:hypothetical protein